MKSLLALCCLFLFAAPLLSAEPLSGRTRAALALATPAPPTSAALCNCQAPYCQCSAGLCQCGTITGKRCTPKCDCELAAQPGIDASRCSWAQYDDGDLTEVQLRCNGRQAGSYRFSDGRYLPLIGGVWGERCAPPIKPPDVSRLQIITPLRQQVPIYQPMMAPACAS